ncbi:MAG: SprT-like domain-containing protein [Parachlamydiaceae bacterium]
MIIYSKKVIQFIQELNQLIRHILVQEVGLKVNKNRFYDFQHRFSYPLCIVIYNTKRMLAYFDSHFYEMGFHECLMQASKEDLLNIIRHEIAHYLVYIQYGETQAHGTTFRKQCEKFGWGPEVYEATIQLTPSQENRELEKSHIFRKVQKLMALASSHNSNEAEQAMIKSQQLLLKHHINVQQASESFEEKIVLKRLMKQKREDAKMRSIARIIETFFVSVVFKHSNGFTCLEVLGDLVNVEIAEYVTTFLEREMEALWDQAKNQLGLKGKIAKNSFFMGIARGYLDKIHAFKHIYENEMVNGLMIIEKKLHQAKEMVYQRLSRSKSKGNFCSTSSSLGEQMGKQLTIRPAIQKSPNGSSVPLLSQF